MRDAASAPNRPRSCMESHEAPPFLNEALLFLALAGVLIPLLGRLKVNPVLGFLCVGALIGPYGLGHYTGQWPWLAHVSFSRVEDVEIFAELGVIFLMFTIGLDLSIDRLWAMRRLVFGLGGLQVGLTALAIGLIAYAWGNPIEAAVILGAVLAFSSTAVVMQLLSARRELGSPLGQSSFAVLLFQDLAVVPLLVLVGLLGAGDGNGSFFGALSLAVAKGVFTVALIYLIGRRLIRPLFHQIAQNRQADTFMALTLLTALGVAALTWTAGLSLEMGALLAGLLIAETEFRHEVEVTIEPFKGLLMGLFFMSVGMGIDLGSLLAKPLLLPLSVLGLILLKGLILFALLRGFGLSWGRALEGGLLLGQGGEFAFIVIGLTLSFKLISPETGQFMLLVVGFSMLVAPLLAHLGQRLGDAIDARSGGKSPAEEADLSELNGHVIIAGFGRVGQLVAQQLAQQGAPYVAIETDAKQVARLRAAGEPVFFGDASRPELLRKLHLERATAVVLTMDNANSALHATRGVRALAPEIRIIARARDERHALKLREAGASAVTPETLESGLQMSGYVLEALGMPLDAVTRLLEYERERRINAYRE